MHALNTRFLSPVLSQLRLSSWGHRSSNLPAGRSLRDVEPGAGSSDNEGKKPPKWEGRKFARESLELWKQHGQVGVGCTWLMRSFCLGCHATSLLKAMPWHLKSRSGVGCIRVLRCIREGRARSRAVVCGVVTFRMPAARRVGWRQNEPFCLQFSPGRCPRGPSFQLMACAVTSVTRMSSQSSSRSSGRMQDRWQV